MSTVDFSVLDLPRTDSVEDPQAYLRAAVQWHFSSATGSPYWLGRAKSLGFDPLTDVKSFDDLALFPNVVDELREVPIGDPITAGYGPRPPTPRVFESGGTTWAPKRAIIMPDWGRQNVEWESASCKGDPRVRDGGLLLDSEPVRTRWATSRGTPGRGANSAFFTVDLDPRWVKKLIARAPPTRRRSTSITSWSRPDTSCAPRTSR